MKSAFRTLAPYLGLALVILFFALVSDGSSVSIRNVRTLVNQVIPLLIVATGTAFIFAHGGTDFSQGGVIGVASLAATLYLNAGGSLPVALVLCVVVGVAFGLLNGVVTTKFQLPSFISAICIMFVARGIVAFGTANTSSIGLKTDLKSVDDFTLKLIVAGVLIAVAYLVFQFTRFGKENRAIGVNAVTAHQSGVSVDGTRLLTYGLSGITIGIAAFFILAHSGAVSRNTGAGVEMDVMIALILGGMPMNGGTRSRISSVVIGCLIVVILSNGLVQWGVDVMLVQIIKGLVFLTVVSVTFKRTKGSLPR